MKALTGRAVRAMRQKAGLTQQEFGSLLHISFVTVNRWENYKARPGRASSVVLHLFEKALSERGRERLVADLRAASGRPLGFFEELVKVTPGVEK